MLPLPPYIGYSSRYRVWILEWMSLTSERTTLIEISLLFGATCSLAPITCHWNWINLKDLHELHWFFIWVWLVIMVLMLVMMIAWSLLPLMCSIRLCHFYFYCLSTYYLWLLFYFPYLVMLTQIFGLYYIWFWFGLNMINSLHLLHILRERYFIDICVD